MKDIHIYGEKMARNGRTKDLYKGTSGECSIRKVFNPLCIRVWPKSDFLGNGVIAYLNMRTNNGHRIHIRNHGVTLQGRSTREQWVLGVGQLSPPDSLQN